MKKEVFSLNESLHSDFFVQELEQRLETDPLIGGLWEWGKGLASKKLTVSRVFYKDVSFVILLCNACSMIYYESVSKAPNDGTFLETLLLDLWHK